MGGFLLIYPNPSELGFNYITHDTNERAREDAMRYGFAVRHDDTDETVLKKVKLMMSAIKTPKINPYACCGLAKVRSCVCTYSFTCPLHGDTCIGSHD
jgi:hypothetical protein